MKKVLRHVFQLSLLLYTGLSFSCRDDSGGYITLEVRLTDDPASYDAVNIHVIGVQVHTDAGGWQSLPTDTGTYDLLSLQNGIDTMLTIPQTIPSGRISQVRLLLGDSNSVVVAGVPFPLSLSSQDESGLKCNLDTTLAPNATYRLLLDFDAGQSVLQEGNGAYRLKPVVSAFFQ